MKAAHKFFMLISQKFEHIFENIFRITDAGDKRITDDGNNRITDSSDY